MLSNGIQDAVKGFQDAVKGFQDPVNFPWMLAQSRGLSLVGPGFQLGFVAADGVDDPLSRLDAPSKDRLLASADI
jgi:hypothetical protein